MVYSSKFVAVLVCNGQILREIRDDDTDTVRLPFGSEYAIRFKNLNSTRVAITVHVDGTDATDGTQLVLGPNETYDLKGFMKGNTVTNSFKFIKKTKEISEHRGDRIDDGLIRIEYQFEKPKPVTPPFYPDRWNNKYQPMIPWQPDIYYGSGIDGIIGSNAGPESLTKGVLRSYNATPTSTSEPEIMDSLSIDSDEGITVKGSKVNETLSTTWLGEMEEAKHTIVFKVIGETLNKKTIAKAVTVKEKAICETCGRKNRSGNKFCYNCGTSLI